MVGGRDTATFRRLWKKVRLPGCRYYTDDWGPYTQIIPVQQPVIGKAGTVGIERDNSNTRHYLARLTRRTKVVSRSQQMVDLTMRLWAYFQCPEHRIEWQQKVISILG